MPNKDHFVIDSRLNDAGVAIYQAHQALSYCDYVSVMKKTSIALHHCQRVYSLLHSNLTTKGLPSCSPSTTPN